MSAEPTWALVAVGLVTGLATLVGGSLVLRFRSALDLLMGFSGGAIIGVALFDLLPEAIHLARGDRGPVRISVALAIGTAFYFVVHRLAVTTSQAWGAHRHLGPASLTLHSLLDGLSIGLAFQASAVAGTIVAIGVLAHDCIDGANTVALSLATGSGNRSARAWLAADASAPLVGMALAAKISVANSTLALLLGGFAGFFLCLGGTQLLRRTELKWPRAVGLAASAVGLFSIYCVTQITGG